MPGKALQGAALPVLYSFRRCPYAIRARMALWQSGLSVELREVVLRDKPQAMLQASPKGTVPVLVLPGGAVINESLAIMRWALAQRDPQGWLDLANEREAAALISLNDGPFKLALDAYKYPERHPAQTREAHRADGEAALVCGLEQRLARTRFLFGEKPSLSDAAIFPFVRQWAAVDAGWFEASPWVAVRSWLVHWQSSADFNRTMDKHPPWQAGCAGVAWPH